MAVSKPGTAKDNSARAVEQLAARRVGAFHDPGNKPAHEQGGDAVPQAKSSEFPNSRRMCQLE